MQCLQARPTAKVGSYSCLLRWTGQGSRAVIFLTHAKIERASLSRWGGHGRAHACMYIYVYVCMYVCNVCNVMSCNVMCIVLYVYLYVSRPPGVAFESCLNMLPEPSPVPLLADGAVQAAL